MRDPQKLIMIQINVLKQKKTERERNKQDGLLNFVGETNTMGTTENTESAKNAHTYSARQTELGRERRGRKQNKEEKCPYDGGQAFISPQQITPITLIKSTNIRYVC